MRFPSQRLYLWQTRLPVVLFVLLNLAAQQPGSSLLAARRGQRKAPRVEASKGDRKTIDDDSTPGSKPLSKDYVIGPEDVLAIAVWHEPDLSKTLPVRPDGKISLPLIGDVEASGRTASGLQAMIAEKLQAFIPRPEVTVIVQEVRSRTFNVVGQVLRPGSYSLVRPTKVLDAIALAGGFADFAKVKKIYVLRQKPDGSSVRIPFNYREVIDGDDPGQNVSLEAGDTVVVP